MTTSPGRARRVLAALPWLLVALPALYQVVLLVTAVAGRVAYPYDLEWMEGGLLHHAQRIHDGAGIYVPPSVEFIPYLYTPLYPALLALFGGVFGLSYVLGRVLSVLSLVGVAVIAAVHLAHPRHEHPRRAPAWAGVALALGLFAAAYPYVEGWYDLVRADTLFLFMVTAGLAALPRWATTSTGLHGHARVAAAAAVLALAFFCKQTGIIYVALGGLIVLVLAWRRLPTYIATAGAIGLGGTWLLETTTRGWFWIYVREIHAAHDFNMDRFWKSFGNILWHAPALTFVVGLALVLVVVTKLARHPLPRAAHPLLLWSTTFAASTVVGAIGWGTEFAHFNAYMPAFLHGALAAGAAVPAVFACTKLLWRDRPRWEVAATIIGLAAAVPLALACYTHRWNPEAYIPAARDVAAGDKLIARLRGIDGAVWMPSHPWYLQLAGKRPYVHRMGIKDVTWRRPRVVDGLEDALRSQAFAAIVLDQRDVHLEVPAVKQHYRSQLELPADERPRVYTGARVVPTTLWVPAIPATPPAGVRAAFDFEQPAWNGWKTTGAAWGSRPVTEPLPGQGLVLGATGQRFATSMHDGDRAVGRLVSPDLELGDRLTLQLGGGADATKLRVEVWIGAIMVAAASVPPPGGAALQPVTIDTHAQHGSKARLVLVDDSPTGHLVVDDVWVW